MFPRNVSVLVLTTRGNLVHSLYGSIADYFVLIEDYFVSTTNQDDISEMSDGVYSTHSSLDPLL